MYPWQKDTLKAFLDKQGTGRVVVVKSRRQCGKTFMCCAALTYYACTMPGSVSAIIEPTNAQARKIFKSIISGLHLAKLIKSKNETFLTIELVNGSTIMFKSAQVKDGLRGYTISGALILDEAAYLQPDILELVLPWTQVHKAPMMLVSTPRVKDGIFFNYWKEGFQSDKVISIDWCKYDTSELLSDEMIAQYRKILTSNQFRSEIMGEFLDTDGMVFTNLDDVLIPNGQPSTGIKSYMGIDFGRGDEKDYTSISVFDEGLNMSYLRYFNDLSTLQQVDLISEIMIGLPGLTYVNAENNSIGKPMIDLIVKRLNDEGQGYLTSKINRWTTTNTSKASLVKTMQVGIEQRNIRLYDDPNLILQYGAYEMEYNPRTLVVRYNGAYGTNDDIVMSTMLAYQGVVDNRNVGQYIISIV